MKKCKDLYTLYINEKSSKSGITLIALVITIVVLLILAAVSINTVLGENGIINNSKRAKEETQKAELMDSLSLKIEEYEIYQLQGEEYASLEGLKQYYASDNDFEYITLWKETPILQEVTTGAEIAKIKLKKYDYEVSVDNNLKITKIDGKETSSSPSGGNGEETPDDDIGIAKVLSYNFKNNNKNTIDASGKITKLKDLSGNDNDADVVGLQSNLYNDAIALDCMYDNYAKINLNQELTYPITIEALLDFKDATNGIIYYDTNYNIALGIWNDEFCLSVDLSSTALKIPTDFYDGNLKHIIVIYDKNENEDRLDVSMYVNGEENVDIRESDCWYLEKMESGAYIGHTYDTNREVKCNIYEFNIYDGPVDEEKISTRYQSLKNKYERGMTKILSYNVKDNNENTIDASSGKITKLKDLSGYNNDADCFELEYNETRDALVFNGGYATISYNKEFAFPVSIETLVAFKSTGNQMIFFDDRYKMTIATYSNYFCLSIGASTEKFEIPTDFYDGNLKHIVVIYNKSPQGARKIFRCTNIC